MRESEVPTDEFREWCRDSGGEVENTDRYVRCKHPVGEGEYKDPLVMDTTNGEFSIPGQWSGWTGSPTDITFEPREVIIASRDSRSLIEFGDDSFQFYWHEDDDPSPGIRETYQSARF